MARRAAERERGLRARRQRFARAAAFIRSVVGFTEEAWKPIFQRQAGGRAYQPVQGFYGQTKSACGPANAATGPFYCPQDQRIYIAPGFFAVLQQELGAGGDFAVAYVVAHAVAPHIQDQPGILGKVNAIRQRSSEADSIALSVRIELQADCLSGVWARSVEQRFDALEAGDIEEAFNAAQRIGDDVLMKRAGQAAQPRMFRHSSAAQRSRRLKIGYSSGQIDDCDSFSADRL